MRERKKMGIYYKASQRKLSDEEQVKLAKCKKVGERRQLARRRDLCKKAAKILLKDPDSQVRFNLACCTTSKEVCKELTRDPVKRIRNVAAARQNGKIK